MNGNDMPAGLASLTQFLYLALTVLSYPVQCKQWSRYMSLFR